MTLPADGLNYFANGRRIIDMKDGAPTKDVTYEDGSTAVVLAEDISTASPQNTDLQ